MMTMTDMDAESFGWPCGPCRVTLDDEAYELWGDGVWYRRGQNDSEWHRIGESDVPAAVRLLMSLDGRR